MQLGQIVESIFGLITLCLYFQPRKVCKVVARQLCILDLFRYHPALQTQLPQVCQRKHTPEDINFLDINFQPFYMLKVAQACQAV